MSNCCNTSSCETTPRKGICPLNGKAYSRVKHTTLLHHLNKPWKSDISDQTWYFCDSPDCSVVYFGDNKQIFEQDDLRTQVGQKSSQPDRSLCYCFDVTQQDYEAQPELTKGFVIEQTQGNTCACQSQNPSGRCCLKDFPK